MDFALFQLQFEKKKKKCIKEFKQKSKIMRMVLSVEDDGQEPEDVSFGASLLVLPA